MTTTTPTITDLELLQGTAAGDRRQFDELVRRMDKLVFGTVYRVLGDVHEAQDVCQDVFVQVWQKAALYNEQRGKPSTWIATMARNRAIDRIRHKQRQARLRERFELEMLPTQASQTAEDSFDLLEVKERGREVRKAVLELSPEQREAIEMAYFRGLTQSEIAGRLDQPLGTVKARIRRGLVKLRESVIPVLAAEAV